MSRFGAAIRCFFSLVSGRGIPEDVARASGYVRKPSPPAVPVSAPSHGDSAAAGAVRLLSLLQQEGRLVDFLMEDISAYSDDQVGAAVRQLHERCRQVLARHFALVPVIDGVEGAYTTIPAGETAVRFAGNAPPGQHPMAGTLRHRGWRAGAAHLPKVGPKDDLTLIAPAEIEVD